MNPLTVAREALVNEGFTLAAQSNFAVRWISGLSSSNPPSSYSLRAALSLFWSQIEPSRHTNPAPISWSVDRLERDTGS